jgi:hypothetical protein
VLEVVAVVALVAVFVLVAGTALRMVVSLYRDPES